jgi:hypothetical protein
LKNSLNLLHLVYLIPLLVAIGILCAARLWFFVVMLILIGV